MNKLIFLILLTFSNLTIYGQTPKELGLIKHTIKDKTLGNIEFFISDSLHTNSKPLLVYLDGSGKRSIFYYKRDKENKYKRYSTIPFDFKKLSSEFHILLISKPHTNFIDTLETNKENVTDKIYDNFASSYWRVESASKAIDFICKKYKVDKNKIIAFGYSEGAQVAPRLSVRNKKITHCIAFVGGALNQFYDEIINNRMKAYKGEISQSEAQNKINSLFTQYKEIYDDPNNTNKFYYGHTYKRWNSYTAIPTIEFYIKLTIPIFIAQGTTDENTNILSTDYLKLDFLRLNKKNLTYKVYPNYDHYFNNTETGENKLTEIINEAFNWIEQIKK